MTDAQTYLTVAYTALKSAKAELLPSEVIGQGALVTWSDADIEAAVARAQAEIQWLARVAEAKAK